MTQICQDPPHPQVLNSILFLIEKVPNPLYGTDKHSYILLPYLIPKIFLSYMYYLDTRHWRTMIVADFFKICLYKIIILNKYILTDF